MAFLINEQRRHTDCTNVFSMQNRFENEMKKQNRIDMLMANLLSIRFTLSNK